MSTQRQPRAQIRNEPALMRRYEAGRLAFRAGRSCTELFQSDDVTCMGWLDALADALAERAEGR